MPRTPCVLSLDWDWFVGTEDQNGCGTCLDCLIGRRTEYSYQVSTSKCGLDRAETRDTERLIYDEWQQREHHTSTIVSLLKRFRVRKFVVANSHGHILRYLPDKTVVHNVDLHEDRWRESDGECASWAKDKRISKYYWYRNNRLSVLVERLSSRRVLDLVFLALSTPHTAIAEDLLFFQFARDLAKVGTKPEFVGKWKNWLERSYSRCVSQ